MRVSVAVIATLLSVTPEVINAEPAGFGVGISSCGTWTAARRDRVASLHEQWVLGFLTGVGYMGFSDGIDPLRETDANAVWAWMDNYCQANPFVRIGNAAIAFVHAHPK